jgi:hypothetical protein
VGHIIYEKEYPRETPEEQTYELEGRKIPDISFAEFMRSGYDIVMSLDYYTHAVFVGGRQIHP